jgi:hypothetical protein
LFSSLQNEYHESKNTCQKRIDDNGHKSLFYFTRNLLVYGGEGIREKHMKVLSCSFGMARNMTNSAN